MEQRLRISILSAGEAWGTHAYLRAGATHLIEQYGTVEDALLMCMYHATLLKELEDAG